MKIRTGFVSNSSTSSFICDICGDHAEGYNIDLADCEMVQCYHGHIFCEKDYDLGDIDLDEDDEKYGDRLRSILPVELCPMCRFEIIAADELVEYLKIITLVTEDEVLLHIKKSNKRRKKVRPEEYIDYVLAKMDKTRSDIEQEIRTSFDGSYEKFLKFKRDNRNII